MVTYYNEDHVDVTYKKVDLDFMPLLLFTSLLCSSDVVAAVSIVSYNDQPKLYSCIFGEGVVNDIVSIILFNTVKGLQGKSFEWYTVFVVIAQFIMLGFVSVGMGLIFGAAQALLFKKARFLSVSPVNEMFIMFGMSMSCYFLTDLIKITGVEMSGIIALLVSAICNGHYTWYNLSPQGRTTSAVTVSFLGAMMEAAVYSYIGIALYSSIPGWWSWNFIFLEFLIIVVFRILGVIGTFYTARLCCRRKTIKFNELMFVCYGGMIRGAIAFALVLKIELQPNCGTDPDTGNDIMTGCYTKDNY
jgi:sodium/hydrogen exchanger-like protein 6/7/sodium/hydrogen exchanger 8